MQWKKVHGERGNSPEEMWDKSFRKHPNLFSVLGSPAFAGGGPGGNRWAPADRTLKHQDHSNG